MTGPASSSEAMMRSRKLLMCMGSMASRHELRYLVVCIDVKQNCRTVNASRHQKSGVFQGAVGHRK